jgi:hypothetical protein
MRNPLSATGKRWRCAFLVGALAGAVAGCGDDEPASPPGVANGGGDGTSPPADPPDAAGGTGGEGGSTAEGGTAGMADAGAPMTPTSGCTEGLTQACTLDLLCSGLQTCGAEGTFGSCVCDTSLLTGGGIVGARCESDGDCASGGTCIQADGNVYRGAGGPAGGYCSFPCTVLGTDPYDDDCDERDPQSFCAPLGPEGAGYCLRTCLSLDPDPGEAKCLNRPDLVCVSRAASGSEQFNGTRQLGYCEPQCGSDDECPAGRVCHAQAGICTDAQVPGAPIGGSCSIDADCASNTCEDQNEENIGLCTADCTLGALSGCGYAQDADPRKAGCLTPQIASGRFSEGVGDLGFCRELCDLPEDCVRASEGWVCAPINAGAQEFFGRTGACVPAR